MATTSNKKAIALVTGASSGIGLELAKVLAREGHDVVLAARSADKLEALAGALEGKHSIKATVIPIDLRKAEAPQELFDRCTAENLQVDILVNNAGIGIRGPFADTDLTRELDSIQINITALTHLTKLFLPAMLARKSGRILNIASTAAFQPGPLMAVYYASKAYVVSFSEAIAEELRDSGVTVTAFCPGPTATNFAGEAGMEGSRLFNTVVASADAAAESAYKAMMRGKRLAIHGVRNWIVMEGNRFTPRILSAKISRFLQENR
jgi:short-subunit dehydrogenase